MCEAAEYIYTVQELVVSVFFSPLAAIGEGTNEKSKPETNVHGPVFSRKSVSQPAGLFYF